MERLERIKCPGAYAAKQRAKKWAKQASEKRQRPEPDHRAGHPMKLALTNIYINYLYQLSIHLVKIVTVSFLFKFLLVHGTSKGLKQLLSVTSVCH